MINQISFLLILQGKIMTPAQIQLVQTSFAQIAPRADKIARLFYCRLFYLNPELRKLFSEDVDTQGKKLMAVLTTAVNSLNNLDALVPVVENLGRRHADYGVKDADYNTVAEALIWTLGEALQSGFTNDVKAAWIETYTILATTMQNVARKAA